MEKQDGGRAPLGFSRTCLLQTRVDHKHHIVNSSSHLRGTSVHAEDRRAPSLRGWRACPDGRADLRPRGLRLQRAASEATPVPFCVLFLGGVTLCALVARRGPGCPMAAGHRLGFPSATRARRVLGDAAPCLRAAGTPAVAPEVNDLSRAHARSATKPRAPGSWTPRPHTTARQRVLGIPACPRG